MNRKYFKILFYLSSLIGIIFISILNNPPFFGKTKFLFLNTFSSAYEISAQLEKILKLEKRVISDPITENFLFGSYGIEVKEKYRDLNPYVNFSISLEDLISKSSEDNTECLVNLKGFPQTWVPRLTGHWNPIISDTARFYEHNGFRGKKLAITLNNQLRGKCLLVSDKELPWKLGENFRYHNPNLNYSNQQEDVHILQFRKDNFSNYNILIDVGYQNHVKDRLLDYLAENEIYSLDEIFITHPHKDHYSGIYDLIRFGIPIKKVWMNMPLKENCDKEIPWGCDYPDLIKLTALLKEKEIEYSEIVHTNFKEPITLYSDSHNKLLLLFASPQINPQPGNVDINDLSMIIKLETNGISYLFTGDLNYSLSEFLKGDQIFKADILKLPHHGTEGAASNAFFDTVNASIGIVSAPQGLWCSERSSRFRNYSRVKKNKTYISGFHGNILFRHFENKKYLVTTEFNPTRICGEKIHKSNLLKFFKN